MPATGTTYSSAAFNNVTFHKQQIIEVANVLGLRPEAIFGALVEENHDYMANVAMKYINETSDGYAALFSLSHSEILSRYNAALESDSLDLKHTFVEKLMNPVLMDVGRYNIKIGTAIRLLEEYYINTPTGQDPLNLRQYQNNYSLLVAHLLEPTAGPAAVAVAGLMLDEAERYFEFNADPTYWAARSKSEKEALYITYYNFGPL